MESKEQVIETTSEQLVERFKDMFLDAVSRKGDAVDMYCLGKSTDEYILLKLDILEAFAAKLTDLVKQGRRINERVYN